MLERVRLDSRYPLRVRRQQDDADKVERRGEHCPAILLRYVARRGAATAKALNKSATPSIVG